MNEEEEQFVDDWLQENEEIKDSLFTKIEIDFSNTVIEQNIDKLMENPILNQPIENFQGNQDQHEDNQKNKGQEQAQKKIQKQQALYNPIQDEQNEKWVKKHCKKSKSPLSCPSCFNQIAYDYQLQQNASNDKLYICRQVFGVQVQQNKIIRVPNLSQTMQWRGAEQIEGQKMLRDREQEINVKILAECSCGYSIGYFDINKDCFVVTNAL